MKELMLILLPALFALADRGIGGLFRRSFVIAPMVVAVGALAYFDHRFLALLVALWMVYRTIPWDVGGTLTPRGPVQIIGSFVRHALPTAAVLGGNVWFGTSFHTAIPLLAYAVVATVLSVSYARLVDDLKSRGLGENGEANDKQEIIRGAVFGLAAAATTLIS